MANSLLDFVMSLVRDPDAAARYAADPAQAIADAHLTDVTSADVQNLIPMVSESLSMAAPAHGLNAFGTESANNVWTSGAATSAFEAFDAFAEHLPEPVTTDADALVTDVVDHIGTDHEDLPVGGPLDVDGSLQLEEPVIPDFVAADPDPDLADDWVPPVPDPHAADPTPELDFFD
ncbi:hypothetical protein NGTWS0302_01520 [Mycolicibacterium cyprinidarum]|uniref:Uncharacterized protein n=1 Tax=Mycolicibacterium cyprinidarum TaxID=2860311 RepID=A0ABQ4V7Y9_9MYCO|nr:hypothetical protein NGTWS0302_01520 [Mycolicibacterium sp. NGTWS0302]GJF12877.1 hypothetical protein NGTWS1702_12370 [Mycolicibacterium sp. NGTWSNA01]